jgi:predicted metal-dependent hydrolase
MKDFSEIENIFDEGTRTETPIAPPIPSPTFPPMPTQYADIQSMVDEAVRLKFKKKKSKFARKIEERLANVYEARLQKEVKRLKKKYKKKGKTKGKKSSSYDSLGNKLVSVAIEKTVPKIIDRLLSSK